MLYDYRTSFMSSPDGEHFTTNTEREFNTRCALSGVQNTATTSYYGFIDLSDTINWPHDNTDRIDFSYIAVAIDKATSARGSLSIGIITRVNATDADITYIAGATFEQNDNPSFLAIANFSPSQMKCQVVGGALAHVKTNTISLNVTAINTGVPLLFGPGGAGFIPAVGDAVIRIITSTGGALTWGINVFYHTHPSIGA